jgi:ATP-binding cassette subfamily B protein
MGDPSQGSGVRVADERAGERSRAGSGEPLSVASALRPAVARLFRRPGLVAIVVLCMAYQAGFNLAFSLAGRRVFDDVIPRRDAGLLEAIAAVMVTALVGRGVAVTIQERTMARLAARVAMDLRLELFEQLHALSPGYFAARPAGDTLARFSSDLGAADATVSRLLPRAAFLSLNIAACGALMFALNWQLAATVTGALLAALSVPRRMGGRAARANAKRRDLETALLADVQENLALRSVVRLFGLEPWAGRRHGEAVAAFGRSAQEAVYASALVEAATVLAVGSVQLLMLVAGAYLVIEVGMSAGRLVAFTALVSTVASSMFGVSQVVPGLLEAASGIRRVEGFLRAEVEEKAGAPSERLPRLERAIRFENVGFSYTGERKDLDAVTLEIPAGHSVALVGPSGSGKSTLLGILMRQYAPTAGSVLLDGRDLTATSQASLFEQMAVVPQESLLFDISVRENIRLGRGEATDAEVERAARQAEVHEVILRLPRGYDTPAGERGAKLSGGQRQRLAIARAVLRDPALLLLDEATSALDAATEAAITRTLATLRAGRTVVSVTHRLDAVTDYDSIVVMDAGRIVERGTHAELLARAGVYRELWDKQHAVAVSEDGSTAHVAPTYLGSIPLFAELGRVELEAIARRFATMHLGPDQVLFRAGDPGDAFYVVARGTVRIESREPTGGWARLCTEGDFFGEIALLDGRPRTATVRTRGATTLLVLTRHSFELLLAERAEIREALERTARGRLEAGSDAGGPPVTFSSA